MDRIMQVIRRFICQHQAMLLALAALALLGRAALPAGWMPSLADGAIAISVCSSEGRATMWLDKGGQVHKSDPGLDVDQDSPCAFASIAGVADLQAVETPLPFALGGNASKSLPVSISPGAGLAAPPPPQTGPPLQT